MVADPATVAPAVRAQLAETAPAPAPAPTATATATATAAEAGADAATIAPTLAVPTPAVPIGVGQSALAPSAPFAPAVVDLAAAAVGHGGTGRVVLRLDPPELGSVTVSPDRAGRRGVGAPHG